MSFLDPVFDVFADLGDSIGDFAESDEGKLAAILAAAYLTGGTSLGATGAGAGTAGAGTAGAGTTASAIGAVEASQVAGLAGSELGAQIAAQEAAKQAALSQAAGITGATTSPVIPQTPLVAQPITPLPPAGDPTLTAKGIVDTTAQDTIRQQVADNTIRQPVADYTKPFSGADRAAMNSNMGYQGSELPMPTVGSTPPANPFMEGLNSFGNYVKQGYDLAEQYPKTAIAGAYLGAKGLGLLDPKEAPAQEKYNGVLTRYKMSPNFQASNAQPNVYKPTYAAVGGIMQAGGPVEQMSMNAVGGNQGYPQSGLPHSMGYASPTASPIPQNVVYGDAGDTGVNPQTGQERFAQGGIAHFARGNLASTLDFYKSLTESQAQAPSGKGDPGIYYDQDPDTRYQDALTAAQIRQAKVNKRAYVTPPAAKRPTPLGQLNLRPPGAKADAAGSSLDPENAAQGGIMHSSLGGYAAGGNPRLLKGPGDGMSDNIPATIAGKQPARLADGEFVIPADVVSHLGNGSTEAGAKRLHEMMNKIRKARTGNSKQGKQINPNKFMPA